MYVIADNGHCVINGLRQVKVWKNREEADKVLAGLVDIHGDQGFTVQYVQVIEKGE